MGAPKPTAILWGAAATFDLSQFCGQLCGYCLFYQKGKSLNNQREGSAARSFYPTASSTGVSLPSQT
jgi:hypothetical protein